MHYLDGSTGVKDLDVWSFYREHPDGPFPHRRRRAVDFGTPKFGRDEGHPDFVGRRVDLIGRSIKAADYSNPVQVLRDYLRAGQTESAEFLAEKAMILIEPAELLGTVVWPEGARRVP